MFQYFLKVRHLLDACSTKSKHLKQVHDIGFAWGGDLKKNLQHWPHVLGQACTTQGSLHMPLFRPDNLRQAAVSMSAHFELMNAVKHIQQSLLIFIG